MFAISFGGAEVVLRQQSLRAQSSIAAHQIDFFPLFYTITSSAVSKSGQVLCLPQRS